MLFSACTLLLISVVCKVDFTLKKKRKDHKTSGERGRLAQNKKLTKRISFPASMNGQKDLPTMLDVANFAFKPLH